MRVKKDKVWMILAAIALGIGVGSSWYVAPPKDSSDYAAWIQAFGSIGAIVAAIQISRDEEKRKKRNAINEAKIKLFLKKDCIYKLHDYLCKASFSVSACVDLMSKLEISCESAINGHAVKAAKFLKEAMLLSKKIEWELFLIALPTKAKDVGAVLSDLSYLEGYKDLNSLAMDELERNVVHALLTSYESLLEKAEFIALENN